MRWGVAMAPDRDGTAAMALSRPLPKVRGTLKLNAPLAPLTYFRVGGPADYLFTPADERDLADLLAACPDDLPVSVIGLGSNLLVRDGGVRGLVIRLGTGMNAVSVEGDWVIRAGCGAPDVKVARAARDAKIAGFSFLRGVPGAIGGALRMNAGAYGRQVSDILVEARGVDRRGAVRRFSPADMRFSYRHAGVDDDVIFTEALFRGAPGDYERIDAEMKRITAERDASQPVRSRTGGSTFKNPPGMKAWELIDKAGCRGLRHGRAVVSAHHCNFLINEGGASAADLEGLGETVRQRVRQATGVELEWEIRRIGVAAHDSG